MKRVMFLIIMVSFVFNVSADALDDILKMNSIYKEKSGLYLEFELTLKYTNYQQKEEKHNCIMNQEKNKVYYKALHTEYVNDGDYSVFIDHSQKLLILGSPFDTKNVDESYLKSLNGFLADTANFRKLYDFNYSNFGKSIIVITPKNKDSEFASVVITLNKDYTMSRVSYNYKKEETSGVWINSYDIVYKTISFKSKPGYFESERFVQVKRNKPVASKKYLNYKVIDRRIKLKNN